MNRQRFITLYLLSLPLLCVVDGVWLGVVAAGFYSDQLSPFIGSTNWIAVAIFYPVFLIGLTFFSTYQALLKNSLKTAFQNGGLFGFFTYLTYDMTNWATLAGWPLSIVVVDIVWGTVLCSLVSGGAYFLYTRLHKQKI